MRLAADANVLLSVVLGGRAKLILLHPEIEEVVTTQASFDEVREYAAVLAKKKRLPLDLVHLAVASLPVTVVPRSEYEGKMSEAIRRIGRRDPEDAELLALSLSLAIPIWSNDKDFEETGIELLTTEYLLRHLRLIR